MIPFPLPLVTCTITQALVLFFNSSLKNIGLVQEAPASSKTVKELNNCHKVYTQMKSSIVLKLTVG